MFSPLIQSLIDQHGFPIVDEDNLETLTATGKTVALFFSGDAERYDESNDVAVVLPELTKAFGGRVIPAIVDRGAERSLQVRYRFTVYPSLVFIRNGGYLGVISRIQDWSDYLRDIEAILARKPTDPPTYEFPEGCQVASLAN